MSDDRPQPSEKPPAKRPPAETPLPKPAPDALAPDALAPDALARHCDPRLFQFETTAELDDTTDFVGQERAVRAVRLGVGMRAEGFNIFALGPDEIDRRGLVLNFLEQRAAGEPPPPDICYVNNFDEVHKPRVLRLPAGTGAELSKLLDEALQELSSALESAFEGEEYQARRQAVQEEASEEQQEAFEQLNQRANERDLTLIRTPMGFVFAPMRDGEVIPPDEMDQISEEDQERLQNAIEDLQRELQKILRKVPHYQRRVRERVRDLNREVAGLTVSELLAPVREHSAEHPAVLEHLDAVEKDVKQNVRRVVGGDQEEQHQQPGISFGGGTASPVLERAELRRYRLHVIVDRSGAEHAPVVYQDMPTFQNLVGRVEYLPVMGALVTDFNLIKAGSLHEADGGYLVLDAYRLLTQPFAWEGLKRALQSRKVRIESPREALGLISTVTLDPEPLAIDVKVVLVGSAHLYYLLSFYDPDFGDLFKVGADFDDRMERTEGAEVSYARLVAGLARQHGLRPFDRSAVARVVDRSARLVGDSEKLSVLGRRVRDLVCEADHWAGEDGAEVVTAHHVDRSVDEAIHRSSRIRDYIQEQIERGTIYIDTAGARVGQINGLSVIQLGDFAFGRPSRITARVRLGKGELIDIEREVELGGPIHSKGVLILSGFLGSRYVPDRPLALSASLVFEQSYGGIEGDSASSAELYALLSAIGEVPLSQAIAVTGSVNQHGQVQPIGGVNEKIEGFFDVCSRKGLTGEQGVLIPAANTQHLMLRDDVVDAVREGAFHVWPVATVDEGMTVLSGLPMGERDAEGNFPEETVNGRVEAHLLRLVELAREFSGAAEGGGE